MGVLDRHLYTSHHAPTDTVARLGPDRVTLARNGCSLPSTVRLSLPRYCTYNPHPCTVITAAHNIHTHPPDAPACLAYQRPLMNPYCMFDLCRPRRTRLGPRSAFPVTCSGAGVDLPGVGHGDLDAPGVPSIATLKRIGFFCFPIKHSTHTWAGMDSG
jgi:hypothetical protein